jgi:DNA-binding FadR family transcriptional regulator
MSAYAAAPMTKPAPPASSVPPAAPQALAPSAQALLKAPLPGANLMEATVERLGTAIKLRLLEPGQQLPPERELAQLIGVSRVTLRSALGALQDAGFITARRGRAGGTFVAEAPPQWEAAAGSGTAPPDNEGFAAWRALVEPAVCELAAHRIRPQVLQDLRARLQRLDTLVDDLPRYRAEDARLHIAIAEATGNARMVRAVTELQADLGRAIALLPPSRAALLHSNRQHAKLVACIAAKDAQGARDTMLEHVTGTARFSAGLLPARRAPVKK